MTSVAATGSRWASATRAAFSAWACPSSALARPVSAASLHRGVRSGGPDEDAGGGVPAPDGGRGEVSAANPAVQAQQGDPVLPAVQDLLARTGQPERQPGEGAGGAPRRGGGQGAGGRRRDQPGRAGTQAGQRAEEPGVSEERRGLQVLLG